MAYTTINKSTDYFNTILYTGDNSSPRTITGVGFQPDMNWSKIRSEANDHWVSDAVRGANEIIRPNGTDDKLVNGSGGYISSFNSDGYVIAAGSISNNNFNKSSGTMVSWNWKANGAGSSNTDGSITSTVSANTTSGFSIVSYTGTGSNATVGHGLGVTPKMFIIKNRDDATQFWSVYHASLSGADQYLVLDQTVSAQPGSAIFNSTHPTSLVFSVGGHGTTNASGDKMIAYCFAEKTGYSKFGSYTGNGNVDGTFVYTGFKPAFVMSKRTDATDGWRMMDATRSSYNPAQHRLLADTSGAEVVASSQDKDFLSNGFKIRNSDSGYNGSGASYIYMAFAAAPLVGTNNVPCTAR